jgi:hypothetical protein
MAGSSSLLSQTVPSPWGGYDTETADAHIAANKCRLLKNLLPGRPGKVVLRGPIRRSASTDSASIGGSTIFSGGWVFGDKLLHADMHTNPVGYMVTDWAPSTPTLSAKVNPTGLNVGLYPFHTRAGNYVYGFTAGAAGAAGQPSPNRRTAGGASVDPAARLMYWTGGNTSGDFVLLGASAHPVGSSDIRTFLNRLFVLGGSVPGSVSPVFATRLYYSSDLGDGTTVLPDNVTSWQTGGTVNQVQLEGTSNDYGVALAVLSGRLIILRRQSTYMMTGSDPTTFSIRKIAGVGCIDPGSVLEWDDGIYFLSDTGLQFFDGTSMHPISSPISGELAAASWQGTTVSELSIVRVSSEHFMMAATGTIRKAWLYHVPTQSWSEITGSTNVFAGGAPTRVNRVVNYPLAYDGAYLFDTSFVTLPEAADASTQAGRDFSPRAGSDVAIPAEVLTRTFRLGSPEDKSQLQRFFIDYTLKAGPGVTSGLIEWDITLEDGRGNIITTVNGFPGDYAGGELVRVAPHRHREVEESVRVEADEIALRWKLNVASPSWPAYAEVQDSALQYQVTRWRS